MKKLILLIGLVVLLAVGVGVYLQLRRPAPTAASLLPANTLLLVQIPDFAASRAELAQSNFAGFLREPAVDKFLAEPRGAWRTVMKRYGVSVNDEALGHIVEALQGEVFLAVTRINVIGNFQAGLVLGADLKGNLLKAKFGLNQAEKTIAERHPKQPIENRRFLGVDYKAWRNTPDTTVCYGFLHSLLICTWGEDTMRDLISRFAGRKDDVLPSLAENPGYTQFLAEMPAGNEFVAMLNVEPVAALLGPLMLMSPDSAASLQKLTRIRNTGLSLTFHPDTVEEVRLTTYQPGSHEPSPPVQRLTLPFTSPQTLVYAVGHTALANAYDQIVQVLGNNTQFEGGEGLRQFDRDMRAEGVGVAADILDKLGPETALIVDWREGAMIPEVALVMELRESETVRPALDKLMNTLKTRWAGDDETAPWDELTSRGCTLRTVRLGSSKITPTYGTTDKFFLLTLSLDAAQDMLARLNDGSNTLVQSPGFQAHMGKVPANGTSYTWCDLPALYPHLANLAQTVLRQAGADAYINLEDLPPAAIMQRYLSPYVSGSASTAEQDLTRSYSPFGSPFAVIGWAAGGYALAALPDLSLPVGSSMSSDTAVPPAPVENQTVESQTPSTQSPAPSP